MNAEQEFPTYRLKDVDDPNYAFSMHRYRPGDRVQASDHPHRHEFFQIVYITQGSGMHYIDFAPFVIEPPVLYFVAAGQVHNWKVAEPLHGYSLLFGPNVLGASLANDVAFDKLKLFHRLSYAPIQLNDEHYETIRRIIEMIVREYGTHNNTSVLNSYLHILLTEIHRIAPSPEAPVNGGITPFHCAEIMYIFHNIEIPIIQRATGATDETFAMQDVMAQAWVNFAYTGDPSQEGLEWGPYTEEGKETMIFDVESFYAPFDDDALVELMAGE